MEHYSLEQLLKKPLFLPALFFLISFLLFAMICPRALSNGDAALYAQQIRNLDFAHRTVHLGYYLMGIPFIHLLPLPADYALNLMSCLYGALCVSALFLITSLITKSRLASFIACVLSITGQLFASNAVFAEVYVPQLFFFLLSITLLLLNRPVFAGISYATSLLITPSAIFGLAMLIPFRRDKQLLSRFAISACALLIAALFPYFSDYVAGGRGLLKASRASLPIGAAFLKEYREFFSGMIWYVPFLLAGVIETIKCRNYQAWGISIMIIWLLGFIAGERYGDVPVQLPCYAFICMIGGLGFNAAVSFSRQRSRIITAGVYLFLLLASSLSIITTRDHVMDSIADHEEYRDTVFAVQHAAKPDFIVLGPWTQGILFEHYLYRKSYTGIWINTEWLTGTWGAVQRDESRQALNRAILAGREIWLLNSDPQLFSQLEKQGYSIIPFRTVFRASPSNTSGS